MKKNIVQDGDPVLRAVAKPVAKKDIGTRKLASVISHMKDLLKKEQHGVAIAAPQIGESLRMFLISSRAFDWDADAGEKAPSDMVLINPELVRVSRKKREMAEGCLSVREVYGTVLRHERASIKAQDEKGKPFIYHGSELIAHIFQHEMDHLDGILYTDKAIKLEDWKEKDNLRAAYSPGKKLK
ncbi:peptide deformylase [Acetobacteraceae bacterium]|nr:peptide deformylase [Candidatus Parcubacteria bacterium]